MFPEILRLCLCLTRCVCLRWHCHWIMNDPPVEFSSFNILITFTCHAELMPRPLEEPALLKGGFALTMFSAHKGTLTNETPLNVSFMRNACKKRFYCSVCHLLSLFLGYLAILKEIFTHEHWRPLEFWEAFTETWAIKAKQRAKHTILCEQTSDGVMLEH